ncbi:MAG: hypothetical protein II727_04305 [Oscillospiraceae bacterium]|nr:hypothetical protein [Oscillospiraceae bacterium]
MKKRKTILALLLALCMAVSLCGCANTAAQTSDTAALRTSSQTAIRSM